MSIGAEITQHMFRSAEGRLGVSIASELKSDVSSTPWPLTVAVRQFETPAYLRQGRIVYSQTPGESDSMSIIAGRSIPARRSPPQWSRRFAPGVFSPRSLPITATTGRTSS
jgi:hypothetical protein